MSKKTVNVPSIYGPAPVHLTICDGPECSNCIQDVYMISWLSLEWKGMETATLGNPATPDPLDFCDANCLKRAVDAMTGA